jgi:hypothetical protein
MPKGVLVAFWQQQMTTERAGAQSPPPATAPHRSWQQQMTTERAGANVPSHSLYRVLVSPDREVGIVSLSKVPHTVCQAVNCANG